jgi:exopolysaccharide production protein ExoZ
MRFIAAAMVVFYHTTIAVSHYVGDISEKINYIAETGASGVHIFFVISGFVMVYSSFSHSEDRFKPSKFFGRRFTRIFPIYWVYCVFYISFRTIFGSGYRLSILDIIGSLLLLPRYSPMIIGPGWTLSYEMYFYLSFGVALILGLSRGLIVLTLFYFGSILLGIILHLRFPLFVFFSNPLLIEFLLGTGIAYCYIAGLSIGRGAAFTLQIVSLILFVAAYAIGYGNLPTAITWGIPSALLIAGLVFNEKRDVVWPFVKRLAFLGDSSYSLYLTHILVIDIILSIAAWLQLQHIMGSVAQCFVIVGACVLSAVVCYELIERRLLVSLRAFGNNIASSRSVSRSSANVRL